MAGLANKLLPSVLLASALAVAGPQAALAHRSGCHNLHTCPSDTTSYACGDLGYPCNGATSADAIAPSAISVPLLVEKAFVETFDRTPSDAESAYWKQRFRNDKDGLYKIRRAMAWHQTQGSFGPPASQPARAAALVTSMNALFRSVYEGRSPTVAENHYWLSRLNDKPTAQALTDAMTFHKLHSIEHR